MAFRIICWMLLLLKVAISAPGGVHIGKDGTVGASFAGYSASAGLGGIVRGDGTAGGLHAEAGTPDGHFAAAGLGGSAGGNSGAGGQLYSTAGKVGHKYVGVPLAPGPSAAPVGAPAASGSSSSLVQGGGTVYVHKELGPGLFDNIFNIPISTLEAVNQYLNNRHKAVVVKPVHKHSSYSLTSSTANSPAHGDLGVRAGVEAGAGAGTGVEAVAGVRAVAEAGAGAGAGTGVAVGHLHKNYNDIFNIPISVLKSVNHLLNG